MGTQTDGFILAIGAYKTMNNLRGFFFRISYTILLYIDPKHKAGLVLPQARESCCNCTIKIVRPNRKKLPVDKWLSNARWMIE